MFHAPRIVHPKGEVATAATDDSLLKMLDKDAKQNLENMAKLYLDPKDWPTNPPSSNAK